MAGRKVKPPQRRAPAPSRDGPPAEGRPALDDIRRSIDDVDAQIQELLSRRARYAQLVGISKTASGKAVDFYRPEREADVLRKALARNKGPLRDEEIARLFREIMSACLAQQEPLKVAFLGPEGTFTQAAVLKHFGSSVRALPLAAIDEVFHEVEGGVADFGVVPIENSSEGTVNHTLDMFLSSSLKICGEVELRIHRQPGRRGHLRSHGARQRDRGQARQHDAVPGRGAQAVQRERVRPDDAAGLRAGHGRCGRLVQAPAAAVRAPRQHDPDRVEAVAQAQVGLCVLHRHRRPRERPARGEGARVPAGAGLAVQGSRFLSAGGAVTRRDRGAVTRRDR